MDARLERLCRAIDGARAALNAYCATDVRDHDGATNTLIELERSLKQALKDVKVLKKEEGA